VSGLARRLIWLILHLYAALERPYRDTVLRRLAGLWPDRLSRPEAARAGCSLPHPRLRRG